MKNVENKNVYSTDRNDLIVHRYCIKAKLRQTGDNFLVEVISTSNNMQILKVTPVTIAINVVMKVGKIVPITILISFNKLSIARIKQTCYQLLTLIISGLILKTEVFYIIFF